MVKLNFTLELSETLHVAEYGKKNRRLPLAVIQKQFRCGKRMRIWNESRDNIGPGVVCYERLAYLIGLLIGYGANC